MRKPIAIAVMTLLVSSAFAAGEVYRWKDTGGIWHYSDQPHPGAELVRGQSTAASPVAATAPAQVAAPPPAILSDPLPVSKEVAQEVLQEASVAKTKRCEKAKVEYDGMVKALRITKTDAKGVVTYLTPAEMDKARIDARAVRDLACGT